MIIYSTDRGLRYRQYPVFAESDGPLPVIFLRISRIKKKYDEEDHASQDHE
jgi:hypothetical protein